MSRHPTDAQGSPEDTVRVAHAAFPRGTLAMTLRDTLGSMFDAPIFAALFARRGQPAASPWRLALVTGLPCAAHLSERPAAEAVRGRIDWQYALGLARTDPGFACSVLSKFRTRVLAGHGEHLLLAAVLAACQAHGLLRARGGAPGQMPRMSSPPCGRCTVSSV